MTTTISGGCQCGAIRYRISGTISEQAICHCRMCQKAVGSVVWPFFTVKIEDLRWTRGQPALYRSSEAAFRGFCPSCGTPLSFQPVDGETMDVSIGSLDRPDEIKPDRQYWATQGMSWFASLSDLPNIASSASSEELERRRPYQHPDHDTETWPTS